MYINYHIIYIQYSIAYGLPVDCLGQGTQYSTLWYGTVRDSTHVRALFWGGPAGAMGTHKYYKWFSKTCRNIGNRRLSKKLTVRQDQ